MKTAQNRTTAVVRSLTVHGINAIPLDIEVDVASGMPTFIIVGLPDAAVSEARDRVRSAIKNSGFDFPRNRVTVNLAPAHIRKVGSHFDLPIALGILAASQQITEPVESMVIGELALNGDVRHVSAAVPLIYGATQSEQLSIVIPEGNRDDAQILSSGIIIPVSTLQQAVEHVQHKTVIHPIPFSTPQQQNGQHAQKAYVVDMKDVIGQHVAKRALTIAAAGMHNIIMSGPPGSGKSMLAKTLPSIVPPMTEQERIETAMIHSLHSTTVRIGADRPFRAPHHTASAVSIIGGGAQLLPGELSMAHNGVLFFDEFPEFRRDVLEALRQPLEDRTVTIHRSKGTATYPANVLVIAAQNPCPCGLVEEQCICSPKDIHRYSRKLSAPLLDRFDLKIVVPAVLPEELRQKKQHESTAQHSAQNSKEIQKRTTAACVLQHKRQGKSNASLTGKEIQSMVALSSEVQRSINALMTAKTLSMRGYIKTLKVARTIADVEASAQVQDTHVLEALQYCSTH